MAEGSCQTINEIPEAVRYYFVTAQDISAEEHVRMQAALQAFVDNSISKTINFPNNAKEDDVADAYMHAWKLGCKGITVYLVGSRRKRSARDQLHRCLQTGRTSSGAARGSPANHASMAEGN